jgi:integrase
MAGSLQQRGKNSWRLIVYAGVGPDGKEIRHRKTIQAASKREAEKELAKFVVEVEQKQCIVPSRLTLAEFSTQWLKMYAKKELSPTTAQGYASMLRLRILPALGHIQLDELKPLHLIKFYDNLKENGIRLDKKPGGLSQQSILHHHRLISSMLQTAVEWQLLSLNVAKNIKSPKTSKQEMEFYDESEVHTILKHLQNEEIKFRSLITLAITTGLRKGELLGLEWQHINFEKQTLEVKQASQYLNGKGLVTKEPKSNTSKRNLSLSDTEVTLLRELKAFQEEQKAELGSHWLDSNRLFTQWNGNPMHPNTVNNWFQKFLKRHGIAKKRFHSLRHTNITLLLAQNVDVMTVIRRAGHADGTMTLNRYGHALERGDRSAAAKLDTLLFTPTQTE